MDKTKQEKKSNIRMIISAIVFIVGVFLFIHFSQEWSGEERIITHATTVLNGNEVIIRFSEKTATLNDNTRHQNNITSGNNHLGYFLELYDSVANKSLDKLRFKAPVKSIQDKPKLFVLPNGNIWIVSTSNDMVYDKPGFILKFEIKGQKFVQSNFTLDQKYRIRSIKDNKVIITDGNVINGITYDSIFGCTYLDLETEKIEVLEPFDMKKQFNLKMK